MNILITGCRGQLGNELQLLEAEYPHHTFFNTDVAELDITNAEAIEAFVGTNAIDGIINCAAYTAVDKAESDTELCQRLNATAPQLLAEAIERRGGWLVQVSTDYVFDGTNHTPYHEDAPTCPASVYGSTKLQGEQLVAAACGRTMIVRTAWLYSPFGNNFVKTMLRLGKERSEVGVFFDKVGTPTYAHDLAVAILTAADKGVVPGIYHFSDEGVCSWYDFTCAIHRLAGITSCNVKPLHTAEYPTPAARPAYSVLDKTKIKQTYNIAIPHWQNSLEACLQRMEQ